MNKEGITLYGVDKENTFINGASFNGNLIILEADYITITGFTIDGDGSASVGIYFDNYSFININNNLIKNNKDYGISYINSTPIIEGNNIENNSSSGIKVATNGAGIIRNNSIVSNKHGIRTYGDSCPEITRNNISNNNTGIYCRESATPIISYNTISNNSGYGILIDNILANSVNPDIGGGEGGSDGKNNITGNFIHGVSNKTTNNIMALNNWWGDANGPKYPGNPNNATISSDWAYWSNIGIILFNPYLTEP
jgi:parallel beta-helix repeat protein